MKEIERGGASSFHSSPPNLATLGGVTNSAPDFSASGVLRSSDSESERKEREDGLLKGA